MNAVDGGGYIRNPQHRTRGRGSAASFWSARFLRELILELPASVAISGSGDVGNY